jgi:Domain of unknown function (DUF5666)
MTTEPTSTETVFTPTPVVPVPRPKRSSRLLDLALGGAAVLAIAGVAFAVGRTTAPVATVPAAFQQGAFLRPNGSFAPGAGGPGSAFALGGRLAIDGTVTAVSADSMTIRTPNGREVTVTLDGSTAYHQATSASAADVAVGSTVTVRVDGGLRGNGNGNGGANANGGQGGTGPTGNAGTPQLTASDVTVAR